MLTFFWCCCLNYAFRLCFHKAVSVLCNFPGSRFQICTTLNSYLHISQAADRLPVQSFGSCSLPSFVLRTQWKPKAQRWIFIVRLYLHLKLFWALLVSEAARSVYCLIQAQQINRRQSGQPPWVFSSRIKIAYIKWTAQDSIIKACLCSCKRGKSHQWYRRRSDDWTTSKIETRSFLSGYWKLSRFICKN